MDLRHSFINTLLFIFIICTHHCAKCTEDLSCKEIESKSVILRLKKYLFCDYDQSIRPTANYKNATTIQFGLIPQSIEVDDTVSQINLHTWTSLVWKDRHLTWDPSKYENIKWIHIKSYEVWVPDIVMHSTGSSDVSEEMPYTTCWLYHKGDVYCVPTRVYTIQCNPDFTWWPYDSMNCTAQFGSWSYSPDEIDFRFRYFEISMDKYEKNLAWDIVRSYVTERVEISKYGENYSTKLMSYHMILKRHANPLTAIYILPATVLMLLTLITLWLEPKSFERMIVANLNLICHLLCMQDLYWTVNTNGSTPPKLVFFYSSSLALACLSLILTSILRHIQELSKPAPEWISSSTASVLRSRIGQILLISVLDPKVSAEVEIDADDNTDLVTSKKKERAWQYVTIILGWGGFFAVLISYLVLLILYLPTSNSGNSFPLNT